MVDPVGAVVAGVSALARLHALAASHGWHLARDADGWWAWPMLPGERVATRIPRYATSLGADTAEAVVRLAEEIGEEDARVEEGAS